MINKLVGAFLLLAIHFSVTADVVSIRADEWFPINGKPGTDRPGYMIELAKVILAEHGHTVDYNTLPWRGSIKMVQKGVFDCVVGADASDAPDFLFSKKAWGIIKPMFYVPTGSTWYYSGLESLKGNRLGVIGGYAYSKELDPYVAKYKGTNEVQVVNANKALRQNIGKLLSDRLDVIVEFDLIMDAKLSELGHRKDIKTAGKLSSGELLYIACTPNKISSKMYINLFSKGLDKMRKNGKLAMILEKYGLKDWE